MTTALDGIVAASELVVGAVLSIGADGLVPEVNRAGSRSPERFCARTELRLPTITTRRERKVKTCFIEQLWVG